jgi:hypothetical protein
MHMNFMMLLKTPGPLVTLWIGPRLAVTISATSRPDLVGLTPDLTQRSTDKNYLVLCRVH